MTTPRMKEKFQSEVKAKVADSFEIKNPMALPKLEKIVINVGLGKQLEGTKIKPAAKQEVLKTLTAITGQKPVMKKAKKSVANFKLRAGYEVGAMVTLRGDQMWEFFDRLVTLAIPRIKDFRGLKDTSFDGQGNYSFGINEQAIFPEVDMASANFTHGMNIQFVFSNSSADVTKFVMGQLGFPFVKADETQH